MLPDRIETGTYAMAVAMTGGNVLLENARADLLQSALDVLVATGAEVTATNAGVRVARNGTGLRRGRRDDCAVSGLSRPTCRRSLWH